MPAYMGGLIREAHQIAVMVKLHAHNNVYVHIIYKVIWHY